MTHLAEILASWDGYDEIAGKVRSLGFRVHEEYPQALSEASGVALGKDVFIYWREFVREYVSNSGNCSPTERRFSSDRGYRSKLLDEMAASSRIQSPLRPGYSLHPELRKIDEMRHYGPQLGEKLYPIMRQVKGFQSVELTNRGDLVEKNKQLEVLADLASRFGFKRAKDCALREERGMRFAIRRDIGGSPVQTYPQIDFEIKSIFSGETLYIDPSIILPGWSYYRLYETIQEGIYGIEAYVRLADIFFTTIVSPVERGTIRRDR